MICLSRTEGTNKSLNSLILRSKMAKPMTSKSITFLLKRMTKDINGGVNYVYKLMSLLIKCQEDLGLPFAKELSDFCPLATLDKDLDVYRMEFREMVISSVVHIFDANLKIMVAGKFSSIAETNSKKTARLLLCIQKYKRIFLKSINLFEIIEEVSESEKLLSDDAFIYCFCYGLKMGILAFKSIVDFSNMIQEIADSNEATQTQIDTVLSCIDTLLEDGKLFYQNVQAYQYFLKDNDITDYEFLKEEENNYSKNKLEKLKKILLLEMKRKENDQEVLHNHRSFTIHESGEEKTSFLLQENDNIYLHTVN